MIPEIPIEAKNMLKSADLKKFSKVQWDAQDWKIFYECIGFAMFKILNRKRSKVAEIDFQI